ncbi:hypothetical protein MRB53_026650 [Persea americana]|uniref:Uncharacterized protein n=1 Tax=Persea americana TaxID=3435 RepID=A0ACC2LJV7_PERAE|nr:hypothetical protein MRB53_026650 [Persea americana]
MEWQWRLLLFPSERSSMNLNQILYFFSVSSFSDLRSKKLNCRAVEEILKKVEMVSLEDLLAEEGFKLKRMKSVLQASLSICKGFRQGHYALLMESLVVPRKKNGAREEEDEDGGDGEVCQWCVVTILLRCLLRSDLRQPDLVVILDQTGEDDGRRTVVLSSVHRITEGEYKI